MFSTCPSTHPLILRSLARPSIPFIASSASTLPPPPFFTAYSLLLPLSHSQTNFLTYSIANGAKPPSISLAIHPSRHVLIPHLPSSPLSPSSIYRNKKVGFHIQKYKIKHPATTCLIVWEDSASAAWWCWVSQPGLLIMAEDRGGVWRRGKESRGEAYTYFFLGLGFLSCFGEVSWLGGEIDGGGEC